VGATIKAPAYRVTFDRIGRNHNVAPLDITRTDADADYLARAIYTYARRHLASRGVEIYVDLEEDGRKGEGGIICGVAHSGGRFTIERLDAAARAAE
jgi:hypothetical protein